MCSRWFLITIHPKIDSTTPVHRTGHTEATKEKIRQAAIKQYTPEARARHSSITKERMNNPETKAKMSAASSSRDVWNKGKTLTAHQRQRIKDTHGSVKGWKRWNNDTTEKLFALGTEPEGWVKGGMKRGKYNK